MNKNDKTNINFTKNYGCSSLYTEDLGALIIKNGVTENLKSK